MTDVLDPVTGDPIIHPVESGTDDGQDFDQPTFEQSDENSFNQVVATIREMTNVSDTIARDFVEQWGQSLATQLTAPSFGGGIDTGVTLAYPTSFDLFGNADFLNGVNWLPLWSKFPAGAPPVFNLAIGDGTFQAYRTDFLTGGQRFTGGTVRTGATEEEPEGLSTGFRPGLPVINLSDLVGEPPPTRGGGRGRADRAFDRNQLVEAGNTMWRSLLLDTDNRQVGDGVDAYMRQANGFWKTQGGNLDFETFMLERIRKQDRYATLYGNKPSHMSEGQWIGSHTNVVNSFPGLRPGDQRREIETSLTSGGSLGGQAQRIGRSERVFRANPSAFTTRLANTVARLGPGGQR